MEFYDLRTIFGLPEGGDFSDGFNGHTVFFHLRHEVVVGDGADHEFHFRVEAALFFGVEGNVEG